MADWMMMIITVVAIRATSSTDGVAISLAVAEQLACSPAYTLFTTHFPAVTEIIKVVPTCKLW